MKTKDLNKIVSDIKLLRVQGANAIAKKVLSTLLRYIKSQPYNNKRLWLNNIKSAANNLAYARPNEPLAQNATNLLFQQIKLGKQLSQPDLKKILLDSIVFYQELLDSNNERIVIAGAKLIKPGNNILTHCHSSTVEKILINAHKERIKFKVFTDETRPLYQGRITAKNLAKAGINVTQVADSSSGFLISPYSGEDLMMDKVVIGADVVRSDGSIFNKIGSYDIAVSSWLSKVPVYVAVNLLKYNGEKSLDIEERPVSELWANRPKGVKVLNYAFDIVPAKLITGLITEFGIIKPRQAEKYVNKYYPWLKM